MISKFINQEGKECKIDGILSFIELVESGQIKENTLLYNEKDLKWQKASEFADFQAVLSNIKQKEGNSAVSYPKKTNSGFWEFILKKKKTILFLCLSIMILIMLGQQTIITKFNDYVRHQKIKQKEFDYKTYGQMTPILAHINSYLIQFQKDFAKMDKEIEQKDIADILAPQALADPVDIMLAAVKLNEIRHILDRYEVMFKKRSEKLAKEISGLNIPDSSRKYALRDYYQWKNSTLPNLMEFFKIKKALISEISELVDFLKRKQGEYWVEGNQIFFLSQADANIYNKHMRRIASLVNKEAYLRKIVYPEQSRYFKKIFQKIREAKLFSIALKEILH